MTLYTIPAQTINVSSFSNSSSILLSQLIPAENISVTGSNTVTYNIASSANINILGSSVSVTLNATTNTFTFHVVSVNGAFSTFNISAPAVGYTINFPGPVDTANLTMYSGTTQPVINVTLWPATNDYSSGTNYLNTTNLQLGHQYNLAIIGSFSYWQQASDWQTVALGGSAPGAGGLDISPYTQIQFDIYPDTADAINGAQFHFTRSTGDDIGMSTNFTDATFRYFAGTLTPNTWNTGITVPLYSMGGLGQFNYYKLLIQIKGGTQLIDNFKFIKGNTGWIYRGNTTMETGWVDASANATVDYAWLPQTLNPGGTYSNVSAVGLFSLNSPPVANANTHPAEMYAANVHVTATAGMWRANYPGGFDISPYTNFAFGAIPTDFNYSYKVQIYNTSNVAIGSAVTITTPTDGGVANDRWTSWNSLLSAFGLGGTTHIGGISVQDTSGHATNVIYMSAIGFWS